MTLQELGAVRRALDAGELDERLAQLRYGETERARAKVRNVLEGFERSFGADDKRPVALCSAPGRTEICGNHTDHQHGRVLAGAVDLDFLACAAKNGTNRIRFQSEGWPMVEVELDELIPKAAERESTAALVRGMAGLVKERGYEVGGFDVYAASEVLPGSGLSSSAACEVLLGVIENRLFCGGELDAVTIAQLGQRAENVYFGKPSGLMDQMASSVGGAVAIDFADPASPVVRSVRVDLEALGYALCIIDSGASHAALTGEYASIPEEMAAVSAYFGKSVLREVDEAEFYANLKSAREAAGDRAVLRAMHFFDENRRVQQQVQALERDDFEGFLAGVRDSGRSSWMLLQNVVPAGSREHQQMALALAACEKQLAGRGACRIHGGGFAGTLLAFVPNEALASFRATMEAVLGEGRCHVLSIRQAGGVRLA